MSDGGCRKDDISLPKELFSRVGRSSAGLHVVAACLSPRAAEKPRETPGSLDLLRDKPGEFSEVLPDWCRDFHTAQLNPGRVV